MDLRYLLKPPYRLTVQDLLTRVVHYKENFADPGVMIVFPGNGHGGHRVTSRSACDAFDRAAKADEKAEVPEIPGESKGQRLRRWVQYAVHGTSGPATAMRARLKIHER